MPGPAVTGGGKKEDNNHKRRGNKKRSSGVIVPSTKSSPVKVDGNSKLGKDNIVQDDEETKQTGSKLHVNNIVVKDPVDDTPPLETTTKETESHEDVKEGKEEQKEDSSSTEETKQEGEPYHQYPPLYLEGLSDFSKLIEVLRTKFLSADKYAKCEDNTSKMRLCMSQEGVQLGFDKYCSNGFFTTQRKESRKSVVRAKGFRTEGNKLFKARKLNEALESYSKAVLAAPSSLIKKDTNEDAKSTEGRTANKNLKIKNEETSLEEQEHDTLEEIALAYANRSATLFQLNHFEDSLRDAVSALSFDYPTGQRHTLLLRQALCLKALGKEDEAKILLEQAIVASQGSEHDKENQEKESYKSFMQMTFEKFTGIPFKDPNKPDDPSVEEELWKPVDKVSSRLKSASDWVKLSYEEGRGRFLKTTTSVPVDETVLSETAFATCLNTQSLESFCHHCCSELGNKLTPCSHCSSVRYCSEVCRKESWESYHREECPHFDLLISMGVLRLALRILLVAGVDNCLEVDNEFSFNSNTPTKQVVAPNSYRSVYNLTDHSNDLSPLVSASKTLTATFILSFSSQFL